MSITGSGTRYETLFRRPEGVSTSPAWRGDATRMRDDIGVGEGRGAAGSTARTFARYAIGIATCLCIVQKMAGWLESRGGEVIPKAGGRIEWAL